VQIWGFWGEVWLQTRRKTVGKGDFLLEACRVWPEDFRLPKTFFDSISVILLEPIFKKIKNGSFFWHRKFLEKKTVPIFGPNFSK